jgi:hypothetical protein
MKLSFSTPHWVLAGLALVGTVAPQVAAAFPEAASVCAEVQQLIPLVMGALGVLSGSALVQAKAAS